MCKVYIYVLKDPKTGDIRYVGLTRFPVKRLNNEVNYPHTKHLKNWVNSLKSVGLKPTMEIVEESEEGAACGVERKWITEMRSRGCRLINYTDGGERGYKCTDEYRAAVSASQKGKKRKPLTAEHRKRIGDANRGRKSPWASKQAHILIQANKGRKMSDEAKKHLSDIGKKVMVGERLRNLIEGGKRSVRRSKFTDEQKSEIKFLMADGYSYKVISDAYGLTVGTISCIKREEMWAKIEPASSVSNPPPYKTIPLIRLENGQYRRAA